MVIFTNTIIKHVIGNPILQLKIEDHITWFLVILYSLLDFIHYIFMIPTEEILKSTDVRWIVCDFVG